MSNLSTTTFRLRFRISHSLPQQGEVEKHGHSMFLEVCMKSPAREQRSLLRKLEKELDGLWIDDFFEPATSENFLLFIYKKMQKELDLKDVVSLALQETSKNRFILKTV